MTNCLLWDAAKAKPGLKREGGCRRDGSSPQVDATRAPTIGSTGSEATGLAPPSMTLMAQEVYRYASIGTASPMAFATNLYHRAFVLSAEIR
jgi:hypothetical protein